VTARSTAPAVALVRAFCPTNTEGAASQRPWQGAAVRPWQGAAVARTPGPSRAISSEARRSEPARAQLRPVQTRTVTGGGGASPSDTMSKWA
jgi:hypothetical protein